MRNILLINKHLLIIIQLNHLIEYYDIVERSLDSYNKSCVEAVKQGFAQIDILLRHMIGQRDLDKKFR